MEKLRREHCPSCKETNVENIVQLREGKPIRIYVRCAKCKTFVARYTLERYLSDKTYESYLNDLTPVRCSGKNIKKEIDFLSEEVKDEFDRIGQTLNDREVKDKKIEDIIVEEKVEGR